MLPLESVERSQKRLYRSIKTALSAFIDHDREIRSYERSFRAALPKKVIPSSKKNLLQRVKQSKLILVGDFHTFRQSQKGFLRLLSDVTRPGDPAAIALECAHLGQQRALDSYCAGYITLEELREELDFDRQWPFSWRNYREIFEFAKSRRFPLIALNTKESQGRSRPLSERDKIAAETIRDLLKSHPNLKVFCLYGELHLARPHLPSALAGAGIKRSSTLIIHQNETSLYWKAPLDRRGRRVEVLQLTKNEFCVLNAVPWVKLKSYLDWVEGGAQDDDFPSELDLDGAVSQLRNSLAAALGLKQEGELNGIELIGPPADYDSPPGRPSRATKEECTLHRYAFRFQRTILLPVRNTILVPSVSTNALTEAASLATWLSFGTRRSQKQAFASGSPLLSQFLIGYLGSKLLNPKRKCNELKDIKNFLDRSKGSKKSGDKKKRLVFLRALQILSPYLKSQPAKRKVKVPALMEIEATRIAGYILANRLYLSLPAEPIGLLKKIYSSSFAKEEWAESLLGLVASHIKAAKISAEGKADAF